MKRIFPIGFVLGIGACGSDYVGPEPQPTPASITGSYALTTVDGAALPVSALDVGAYHIYFISGSLTLNVNNTYRQVIGLRVDDSGRIRTEADTDAGTWTLSDHALLLTSEENNFERTAIIAGNVLTMQSSSRVMVLRK